MDGYVWVCEQKDRQYDDRLKARGKCVNLDLTKSIRNIIRMVINENENETIRGELGG